MEESVVEVWWGLGDRETMILLVQNKGLELKGGVWRGEVVERGNIWALSPP